MDETQRNSTGPMGHTLIVGATGAGKTSLWSEVLKMVATTKRDVVIEDCPAIALKPGFPNKKDTPWPKS